MDTLIDPPLRSRSRGKSHSRVRALIASRRDYFVGILLLLAVVVLWTSSNFVTQVSGTVLLSIFVPNFWPRICLRVDTRNLSCALSPLLSATQKKTHNSVLASLT